MMEDSSLIQRLDSVGLGYLSEQLKDLSNPRQFLCHLSEDEITLLLRTPKDQEALTRLCRELSDVQSTATSNDETQMTGVTETSPPVLLLSVDIQQVGCPKSVSETKQQPRPSSQNDDDVLAMTTSSPIFSESYSMEWLTSTNDKPKLPLTMASEVSVGDITPMVSKEDEEVASSIHADPFHLDRSFSAFSDRSSSATFDPPTRKSSGGKSLARSTTKRLKQRPELLQSVFSPLVIAAIPKQEDESAGNESRLLIRKTIREHRQAIHSLFAQLSEELMTLESFELSVSHPDDDYRVFVNRIIAEREENLQKFKTQFSTGKQEERERETDIEESS